VARLAASLLLALVLLLAAACAAPSPAGTPDAQPDASHDAPTLDAAALEDAPPAAPVSRPLDPLEALFARHFRPTTVPARFNSPSGASYHCLAAASAYRRARDGAAFAPAFRDALRDATRAAADSLVASAPRWGGAGWGLDKPWDAFGDGTTNAATAVYAFQTGLAIWCLAEAADALGMPAYRALAERAMNAYRGGAFVPHGEGYPINCASCAYFFYSRDRNDRGRLVKNTNIEMAVAALAIDRYGADPTNRAAAAAAALAQYREIMSYANYGYLGRYDPMYRAGANEFDDHNSFEAYLLLRAAEMLGRTDFLTAARTHYTAYAPRGDPAYVAYAACHFVRILPAARATCTAFIKTHGATNPAGVGLVMDYR
jgi:hypothetical protein